MDILDEPEHGRKTPRDRLIDWGMSRQVASYSVALTLSGNQESKGGISDNDEVPLVYSGGFNGRVNKPVDTCYSFWVGAMLSFLQLHNCGSEFSNKAAYDLIDRDENIRYILSAQTKFGGFGKDPSCVPGMLDSCLQNFCHWVD